MKTNSISAGRAVHARTMATTRHLILRPACFWTGFLAFAAIAFGPQPAQAAVTEAWVQRYSNILSNATDRAIKVVRDAAIEGDVQRLHRAPVHRAVLGEGMPRLEPAQRVGELGREWLSLAKYRASLPAVVVLPEPWSPTIITPVGRPRSAKRSEVSTGPIRASSSS